MIYYGEQPRTWAAETEEAMSEDQQQELEGPAIAVPPDWEGSDAEAVGLAVAGAMGGIQRERDLAVAALAELLAAFPETSWAGDADARERASNVLEALGGAPDPTP